MNLVKQNRATEMTLPGLGLRIFGWEPPIGKWLGSAIRWVGGAVAGKLKIIPVIGNKLAGEVETLTEYVAKQTEDQLTAWGLNAVLTNPQFSGDISNVEAEKLNKWLPTFKAYSEALTDEIAKAFSLTDHKAMLTGLNAVLNKINAVQDHYAVTNELGLSDEANKQRQYVIYESFKLIVTAISIGLKEKGLKLSSKEVTFPINQYDYRPLFSSTIVTSVTGDNYVLSTSAIGGGTKLPVDKGGVLNPTSPIQTVKPGNGTTVPVQTDNGTTANPTTETKKNYKWLWWLLAGYGGYKVVKAVSKDNKKSKK